MSRLVPTHRAPRLTPALNCPPIQRRRVGLRRLPARWPTGSSSACPPPRIDPALLLALAAVQPAAPDAAQPTFATLTYRSDGRYAECGSNPCYPDRACQLRKDCHAVLDCGATDDGVLVDWRVIGEDPTDFGFGEGALRMAKAQWITLAKPVASQPRSDDFRVKARVEFKLRR